MTHSRNLPLSEFSLSFPRLCPVLGYVSYVLLSDPPLVLLQETCMSKCKPDSRNLQQDKLEFNSQPIAETIVIIKPLLMIIEPKLYWVNAKPFSTRLIDGYTTTLS